MKAKTAAVKDLKLKIGGKTSVEIKGDFSEGDNAALVFYKNGGTHSIKSTRSKSLQVSKGKITAEFTAAEAKQVTENGVTYLAFNLSKNVEVQKGNVSPAAEYPVPDEDGVDVAQVIKEVKEKI